MACPTEGYNPGTINEQVHGDLGPLDFEHVAVDEAIVKKLTQTNYAPPHGKAFYGNSTQKLHYQPNGNCARLPLSHNLQRSSVPIGTMGKYIEGCYKGYWKLLFAQFLVVVVHFTV